MRYVIFFTLSITLMLAGDANAQRRGRGGNYSGGGCSGGGCSGGNCGGPVGFVPQSCGNGSCQCGPCNCTAPCACDQQTVQGVSEDAVDALDVVNAQRSQLGLPAFVRDEGLTAAALGCVRYRARIRCHSHCNDFRFLPAGVQAEAAGCEGFPGHMQFAACCTRDRYRFAGAAWRRGENGLYCQIFVSNQPSGFQPGKATKEPPRPEYGMVCECVSVSGKAATFKAPNGATFANANPTDGQPFAVGERFKLVFVPSPTACAGGNCAGGCPGGVCR